MKIKKYKNKNWDLNLLNHEYPEIKKLGQEGKAKDVYEWLKSNIDKDLQLYLGDY